MDFPPEWSGHRFAGQWTEQNCGGTPLKMTEDQRKKWALNPQYEIELEEDGELFITLG